VELPRRKHRTYRTRRKFEIKNTSPLWGGKARHIRMPMEMEQTECSETPAYEIKMPGNYREENIQQQRICSDKNSNAYEDGTDRMFRNVGI